jgi:type II restriction enzyme
MRRDTKLNEARAILADLDLPKAQRNERTALCLLALLNLTPNKNWSKAESPMIGITPIMDWVRKRYHKRYAPNTRETIRRQSMHQFVQAGIALYNPDKPERPVNSPWAVTKSLLNSLKFFGHTTQPNIGPNWRRTFRCGRHWLRCMRSGVRW